MVLGINHLHLYINYVCNILIMVRNVSTAIVDRVFYVIVQPLELIAPCSVKIWTQPYDSYA